MAARRDSRGERRRLARSFGKMAEERRPVRPGFHHRCKTQSGLKKFTFRDKKKTPDHVRAKTRGPEPELFVTIILTKKDTSLAMQLRREKSKVQDINKDDY